MRSSFDSARATAIGIAVLVHVAAILGLLQLDSTRAVLRDMAPIMASVIPPPRRLEAPPQTPKPEAAVPRSIVNAPPIKPPTSPQTPTPLLTAEVDRRPAIVAPAPAEVAAPPTPPAPVAAMAPPAPPPPAPLVPPSFNAAYLDNPKPVYPLAARRMEEQGTVMLRVYVSATGLPERVQVHSSSGSLRLDQAARDAVQGWKFVPARQGQESVAAWIAVPIVFSLK